MKAVDGNRPVEYSRTKPDFSSDEIMRRVHHLKSATGQGPTGGMSGAEWMNRADGDGAGTCAKASPPDTRHLVEEAVKLSVPSGLLSGFPCYCEAPIMARMPALSASGRSGHPSITRVRSRSVVPGLSSGLSSSLSEWRTSPVSLQSPIGTKGRETCPEAPSLSPVPEAFCRA